MVAGLVNWFITRLVMRFVVRFITGFMFVRFDNEGRSDLGGVLSFALVLNVGVESVVVVSCVGHLLNSSVWKMDGVASVHVLSVALLGCLEIGTVAFVLHPIGEAVGLRGGFVTVVLDGRGMGGDGAEKEGGETEGTHCGCCYRLRRLVPELLGRREVKC